MFTQNDLKILNQIQTKSLTASIYLNADQKVLKPESIRTNFRDLLKKLEKIYGDAASSKTRKRFRLRITKNIRSLIFFVNPKENIFYEYELPCPVTTALYLEKNLHLTPLAKILDEYERYLVAVFDKSKAKVFSVYLSEIEEQKNISQSFPGKHDMGGWSQARYQRHIEEHMRQNLKKVRDVMIDFAQKYKFDRIILAGTPEASVLLKKILYSDLQKKIVGQFKAELFASNTKLLAQAAKIAEKIERQKEKEKVSCWHKFLGFGDKSCSGFRDVITAACQKRVLELLLDVNLERSGYKCFSCGNLSLTKQELCLNCGEKMETVDVVDELVQTVLAQNAKVEFVDGDSELKKVGGVGARLRY